MKILRLIFLVLHIGIFLLLVGVLLNAYIPPKIFSGFNLLSLGFPILIIAYILLTLFWIFSWKKRAIVFIILGLLFVNPVKRLVNINFNKDESFDLKIVSLNARTGNMGTKRIEDYIDSTHADILLLQEHGGSEYRFKNLKEIRRNAIIAVFSKYKIIDQKELINSDFETNNAYASQIDIEIKGKIYRFINVYLQPFKLEKSMVKIAGSGEEDEQKLKDILKKLIPTFKKHQEQVESIRKGIENSPYPVILAGDFNSVPNSYEYYHISKGLKDAFFEVGNGSSTSFHDYKFPLRIDYVFFSESIKPTSYQVDRSVRISDHFPVIVTFKLKD